MAVSSATAGFGNIDATTSGAAETLFDSGTEGFQPMEITVWNRSSQNIFINCDPLHNAADFVQVGANLSVKFRYDGGGSSGPRGRLNSVTGYSTSGTAAVSWAVTEL